MHSAWPTSTELQAVTLERMDQWGKAMIEALTHQKKISVPGELQIERPGQHRLADESKPKGLDGRRIAQFFAGLGG